MEIVIDAFDKVMETLSPEEKRRALLKVNSTKEFVDAVDQVNDLQTQLSGTASQLKELAESNTTEKKKLEKKIITLTKEIEKLEGQTQVYCENHFVLKNGSIKLNPNFNASNFVGDLSIKAGTVLNMSGSSLLMPSCQQCGIVYSANAYTIEELINPRFKTCPSCKKSLCKVCWPTSGNQIGFKPNDKCPSCEKKDNLH